MQICKVALIVIYNHRYDKNIDIVERIYEKRFSNIYHLMPFYDGDHPRVIPVYENSYYFQGYVAQGLKSFYHESFDHYFFIADDMVLNPEVNETNYTQYLQLGTNGCFCGSLFSFHQMKKKWPRVADAFWYQVACPGIEVSRMLPDRETVLQRFKAKGLETGYLEGRQLLSKYARQRCMRRFRSQSKPKDWWRKLGQIIRGKAELPYPMVGAYSDIFVVSKDTIKPFCHYCGIFAATHLFVETALPTALVMTADELVTEDQLKLQGRMLWSADDFKILEPYHNNFAHLMSAFPQDLLYIHPIKLSQWNLTT